MSKPIRMNSKSNFEEPNKIKHQREEDKPVDGKNSPWDYRCPQYDQRNANFVQVGTHYGTGVNQPVGSKQRDPLMFVTALPQGRVDTMIVDERG